MKILVLNCGSSSIKYKLYDMASNEELASGGIEKIGLPDSFLKFSNKTYKKEIIEEKIEEHTYGVELILKILVDNKYGSLKSLDDIDAVGHRVVHGGDKFKSSVVINEEVISDIEKCIELAPLHNPANLKGIYAIDKILPNVPQIAVFDTSFHQTMPDYAYVYPLPYEYYLNYGIRRYGFHGTSHRYVYKRACELLNLPMENSRIITAHIGNGGSITAIRNGQSVDTSMGMTPVAGIMMGTRCGNIDLGILSYLRAKENMDTDQINDVINKKSGLLGVSGVSSDMRDIEAAINGGNERAKLALDIYMYDILKYIGGYVAVLGGVDAIVFTGGVGENSKILREYLSDKLSFLGIEFNHELNEDVRGREVELTYPNSRIKVVVIPTDEELAIASDTQELVSSFKF